MAVHGVQGLMGAGKTCVAVNRFMADWLTNSDRHIYTNLPLERVDPEDPTSNFVLVNHLTRNHARRRAMMKRLELLSPGVRQPLADDGQPLRYHPLDEDGNPVPDSAPQEVGPKHGLREFWYFTKPNAVVILDEVADIWNTEDRNSRDASKRRPETLNSYIRHHRHYKDDLYFFFQDKEDIDPHLRRKLQYVWTVRNSTKENMFDWWALRGLKWPVQFFFVKCYLGRAVVGKAEDAMKRVEPQESWIYWPTRKSFQTYRSFSQATTLPGKSAPKSDARSTDFDPSVWGRVKGFTRNLGPVLAVLGAVAALVFAYFGIIHGLIAASETSSAVNTAPRTVTPQGTNQPPGTFLTDVGNGDWAATRTNVTWVDVSAATNQAGLLVTERILLVTPDWLQTTVKKYAKGDDMGGRRIERILLNGLLFADGGHERYDVLFSGHRLAAGPGR